MLVFLSLSVAILNLSSSSLRSLPFLRDFATLATDTQTLRWTQASPQVYTDTGSHIARNRTQNPKDIDCRCALSLKASRTRILSSLLFLKDSRWYAVRIIITLSDQVQHSLQFQAYTDTGAQGFYKYKGIQLSGDLSVSCSFCTVTWGYKCFYSCAALDTFIIPFPSTFASVAITVPTCRGVPITRESLSRR